MICNSCTPMLLTSVWLEQEPRLLLWYLLLCLPLRAMAASGLGAGAPAHGINGMSTGWGDFVEMTDAKFDWHRRVGADPRDPRCVGVPCRGHHAALVRRANGSSATYLCEACQLVILYVPRRGCSGKHRSAGPLPADQTTVRQPDVPPVTHPIPEMRQPEAKDVVKSKKQEKKDKKSKEQVPSAVPAAEPAPQAAPKPAPDEVLQQLLAGMQALNARQQESETTAGNMLQALHSRLSQLEAPPQAPVQFQAPQQWQQPAQLMVETPQWQQPAQQMAQETPQWHLPERDPVSDSDDSSRKV